MSNRDGGNGWGGEREGAGRPVEFDQRLLVRLTGDQREALAMVQAHHKLASLAEATRWLIDTYSKGKAMKAAVKILVAAMLVGSSACAYLRPAQPVYAVNGYGYGGAPAQGTSGHGGHGGGSHGGHR